MLMYLSVPVTVDHPPRTPTNVAMGKYLCFSYNTMKPERFVCEQGRNCKHIAKTLMSDDCGILRLVEPSEEAKRMHDGITAPSQSKASVSAPATPSRSKSTVTSNDRRVGLPICLSFMKNETCQSG